MRRFSLLALLSPICLYLFDKSLVFYFIYVFIYKCELDLLNILRTNRVIAIGGLLIINAAVSTNIYIRAWVDIVLLEVVRGSKEPPYLSSGVIIFKVEPDIVRLRR